MSIIDFPQQEEDKYEETLRYCTDRVSEFRTTPSLRLCLESRFAFRSRSYHPEATYSTKSEDQNAYVSAVTSHFHIISSSYDQDEVATEEKGRFATIHDPDTPPVTEDVDQLREKYSSVFDLLFSEENSILYAYCTFGDTDVADADPFASSILQLYRGFGRHLRLLRYVDL